MFLKVVSCLLLLGVTAHATLFEGGYIGGQISFTNRYDQTYIPEASISKDNTILHLSEIHNTKKNFYRTYGFVGGYGIRFLEKGYGGLEVNFNTHNHISDTIFNYKKCQLQNQTPQGGGGSASLIEGIASLKANYRRGGVYSLMGRLGIILPYDTLIYTRLGLEYSRDKLIIYYQAKFRDEIIRDEIESTHNSWIWVPGVGIEKGIGIGKFIVRLEYNYSPGISLKHTSKEGEPKITQHMTYRFHMVKIGLMYNF